MGILAWATRNWADTDEPGGHAPAPLDLPQPLPEAMAHIETAIRSLPRWRLETADPSGTVKATRRTRFCRFIDDITIRVESTLTGSRIHARSQSRIGKGDLGQNRRNLIELYSRLTLV